MADITLNIIIPDAQLTRVVEYLNKLPGSMMKIEIDKHNTLRAEAWLREPIPDKGTDSYKVYGEKIFRRIGLMLFDALDISEDEIRYHSEVSTIIPPSSDVPEDILI